MEVQPELETSAKANESATPSAASESDIPISCYLDEGKGMFRITRSKGKALSSGGFGISIPSTRESEEQDSSADDQKNASNDKLQESTEDSIPGTSDTDPSLAVHDAEEYLFIEEVLFLRQRGLLECIDPSGETTWDESQLVQLLPKLGVSLPQYFVFAHLRSQDFRVLRHAPDRLGILKRQQASHLLSRIEATGLKHEVRASIAQAKPPAIPSQGLLISWDVYNPNSNFAKTHPGLPDFFVATTYYNHYLTAFSDIFQLMHSACDGIPLKIATVSDSGTVVMFGVTDFGVAPLDRAAYNDEDDD